MAYIACLLLQSIQANNHSRSSSGEQNEDGETNQFDHCGVLP